MPLNDESCAVVVICVMMLLYCVTRLARMVWEAGSATAAVTVPAVAVVVPLMSSPAPVGAVPDVVIVWLAASLVDVKVSVSAVADTAALAVIPFEFRTLLSWSSVLTVAVPEPVAKDAPIVTASVAVLVLKVMTEPASLPVLRLAAVTVPVPAPVPVTSTVAFDE